MSIAVEPKRSFAPAYWKPKQWESLGIKLNAAFVYDFSGPYFTHHRNAEAQSKKTHLYVDPKELEENSKYAKVCAPYMGSDITFRASALVGKIGQITGCKCLRSNPVNKELGLPRQHSDIIVTKKHSGETIGIVEGSDISNIRTALYAATTLDIFFPSKEDVNVFMFGSGKVAQEIARMLNYSAGIKIEQLILCSPNSSKQVVAGLLEEEEMSWSFPIKATTKIDYKALKQADLVITCTSNTRADGPLFETKKMLKKDVVSLSLCCIEYPMDFIDCAVKKGTVICDDVQVVSDRGDQSLTEYFEIQGTTLANEAPTYNVKNLSAFIPDGYPAIKPMEGNALKKPACVTRSGMAALDVAVAHKLLEVIAMKTHATIN